MNEYEYFKILVGRRFKKIDLDPYKIRDWIKANECTKLGNENLFLLVKSCFIEDFDFTKSLDSKKLVKFSNRLFKEWCELYRRT